MKKYIPLLALIAACGAPEQQTDSDIDLGELEQPILADNDFGVLLPDMVPCSGWNGNCYYPPGWGDGSPAQTDGVPYQWRVCLDSTTLEGSSADPNSQLVKATNATANVIANLTANNAWVTFVACGLGTWNIRIRATNLGTAYGIDDVRTYMIPSCTQSVQLSESPSISGTHRYCSKWDLNLEMDDIFTNFASAHEYEAAEQSVGAGMGVAVLGAGVHAGSTSIWTYWNMLPVGRHGYHGIEHCRANARYDNDGGASYNILTKTDNACD